MRGADQEKLDKARELGAFETINAARTDPVKAVLEVKTVWVLVILGYHYGQTVALNPAKLVYKWI